MARTVARSLRSVASVALLGVLQACASRAWVMVPPKVDLGAYQRIGLVEFRCSDVALQRRATLQFQELILEARPGSRLVEIDADELPPGAVGADGLDVEALHALAERHQLDALFIGTVEFTDLAPEIGISSSLIEISARKDIEGRLSARLIESDGAATVWTRSAGQRITVASGSLSSTGTGSLGMSDPAEKRAEMVHTMAVEVTHDFRPRYFRQKVADIPPDYQVTYADGEAVYVPPAASRSGS